MSEYIKIETPSYGKALVKHVMIDSNGTLLEPGLQIEGEDFDTFEIEGVFDLYDLSGNDVEDLIQNSL